MNDSPLPRILQGEPYTVPGTDRTSVALAREQCPDCLGKGWLFDPEMPNTRIDCPECKGRGFYEEEA